MLTWVLRTSSAKECAVNRRTAASQAGHKLLIIIPEQTAAQQVSLGDAWWHNLFQHSNDLLWAHNCEWSSREPHVLSVQLGLIRCCQRFILHHRNIFISCQKYAAHCHFGHYFKWQCSVKDFQPWTINETRWRHIKGTVRIDYTFQRLLFLNTRPEKNLTSPLYPFNALLYQTIVRWQMVHICVLWMENFPQPFWDCISTVEVEVSGTLK